MLALPKGHIRWPTLITLMPMPHFLNEFFDVVEVRVPSAAVLKVEVDRTRDIVQHREDALLEIHFRCAEWWSKSRSVVAFATGSNS